MQLKSNLPDTAENRLKETLFIVEATSCEQHMLWERHSGRGMFKFVETRTGNNAFETVEWEEMVNGWGVEAGRINKRPVMISVSWAKINGQLIMFYYGMSQVVDYKLIDKWLDENFTGKWDNGKRRAQIDAMNFGHCLDAIKEANKIIL